MAEVTTQVPEVEFVSDFHYGLYRARTVGELKQAVARQLHREINDEQYTFTVGDVAVNDATELHQGDMVRAVARGVKAGN